MSEKSECASGCGGLLCSADFSLFPSIAGIRDEVELMAPYSYFLDICMRISRLGGGGANCPLCGAEEIRQCISS